MLGEECSGFHLEEGQKLSSGQRKLSKGKKKPTQLNILVSFILGPIQSFYIVVQLLSRVQLFATPWTAAHRAFLSFTDFLLLASIYYTSSTLSKACIIVSVDTARDKVACCITFVVKFSWMNLNSPQEFTSLKIGVIFT